MITSQEYLETVKNMRNRTTRLDREGDYWTQEEREKLTRLFDSGAGLTDIAIQLQRTEPAVYQQAEKLDLYRRQANPVRHKDSSRANDCLCDRCRLDTASCPRSTACMKEREGIESV
ncbi:MAG: hypothetical protein PUE18_01530 [Firmicutes bacterium]|nr:hypothetical protein [Bacillota bacterium]